MSNEEFEWKSNQWDDHDDDVNVEYECRLNVQKKVHVSKCKANQLLTLPINILHTTNQPFNFSPTVTDSTQSIRPVTMSPGISRSFWWSLASERSIVVYIRRTMKSKLSSLSTVHRVRPSHVMVKLYSRCGRAPCDMFPESGQEGKVNFESVRNTIGNYISTMLQDRNPSWMLRDASLIWHIKINWLKYTLKLRKFCNGNQHGTSICMRDRSTYTTTQLGTCWRTRIHSSKWNSSYSC